MKVLFSPIMLTGCSRGDGASSLTAEQQTKRQQQAVARVQSDSRMPPEVRQKVMLEMQTETARRQNTRE
jgi:hypothetical protein